MIRLHILLALIAAFVISLACVTTGTPPPLATSTAPAIPQSGILISATPIKLIIPPGLATGATGETIDVITEQTGAPWDVAPAHLQLTLQGYAVGTSFHVPQLFVYPAQQYAGLHAAAAESIRRLQAILANPVVPYQNDALPRVPFFNAGQILGAQQKVLKFSTGFGIRFVTQYGQDVSPINNSSLFYHFEGLTDDGKYYIVAVLPVNVPLLAADGNPETPAPVGGVPFPASASPGSSFEDYFKRVSALIESTPAERFVPSLTELDTLIQSISTP